MELSEIQNTLENCEIFKGLDAKNIEKIADLCAVESHQPCGQVFQQGDFGDRIYIIAEGSIFLERTTDLGSRKGNAVIGMLGKGRAFGCWSCLLGEPHSLMSSAICQKETTLLSISGTDLREVMGSNAELGFRIMERICFLLRDRVQGVFGAMEKF